MNHSRFLQRLAQRLTLIGASILVPAAAAATPFPAPIPQDASMDGVPMADPVEKPAAARKTTLAPDRATIQKLHDGNQMEIEMGTLAKDKGSTKAVRELGRKLVADHTAADKRLDDYLRRRGADLRTLATTTSADPEHELLATKTGTDFDRAFGLQMVTDHTKAIELIESARIETSDGELRELYEVLLPTLQAHKRAAQDIVAASARS